MKNISILGSTGSIGTQTLEVVRHYPALFSVKALSAYQNVDLVIKQAKEFKPDIIHIADNTHLNDLKTALKGTSTKVLTGEEGLIEIATYKPVDIVLSAIVGFAGLIPTIEAIKAGKQIALANKETLVVAGDIVTSLARNNNVDIIPVDSEHSAIYQVMQGETYEQVRRLLITASGGPFRTTKLNKLHKVSCEDALNHPNWNMGSKISIDSATMMNKGLEVIEAYHLFKIPPFKIEVVIHPQSIIHSMVEFKDRSIKAQMGLPDMRVPIQYALSYPKRIKNDLPELNFADYPELTFEQPDHQRFPALNIAFEAIRQGGNFPCIINAANEMAVEAFLDHKINFMQIPIVAEKAMETVDACVNPGIDELIQSDRDTRTITEQIIKQLK